MLLVKQTGLRRSGDGGLAASYSHHAKDIEFHDGRTRNIDAVGVGVEVRGGEVQAVVNECSQVVWNYPFKGCRIPEGDFDPKPIEFRPAQEGFAFWSKALP